VIFEIIVESVVLKILTDDYILAEFLDNFIPYAMIGANIGEFLYPDVNGAFRHPNLESTIDILNRLLYRVSEVVMSESRCNDLGFIGLMGESILPELFSAILAAIDLTGTEFEPSGSFPDYVLTMADWTGNRVFHYIRFGERVSVQIILEREHRVKHFSGSGFNRD